MQTETFTLQGMTTNACAERVTAALAAVEGVSAVTVSLAGMRATIEHDPAVATGSQLRHAVELAGYRAEPSKRAAGSTCCGACGG